MFWFVAGSTTILLAAGTFLFTCHQQIKAQRNKQQLQRAEDELHPLLKDQTSFRSYTTKYATYPRIRIFYHAHSHKDKHADISRLPLLVVIHGLGGVLPQFAPILGSLNNIAPCFGLELPGYGRSSFEPKEYEAYTLDAFVALWKIAIEDLCSRHGHNQVVLIGHSMGCSIAALLASSSSFTPTLAIQIAGMIAICPRANAVTATNIKNYRRFMALPDFVIDIFRWLDRRGGENSQSVKRMVGDTNESDLKHMQYAWNKQFRTPVWKRTILGLLPRQGTDGSLTGGLPDEAVWKGINIPIFLIAGESDQVTPAAEAGDIFRYITGQAIKDVEHTQPTDEKAQQITNGLQPVTFRFSEPQGIAQAITLPAPAAHALLYAHSSYRLVSALIENFLAIHVSAHLDFSYQLRLLTTSGKWDVKNLEKWKAVLPVSGPIAVDSVTGPNGLFRSLKTMREQDDEHNPTLFTKRWADKIYAVIDISHDTPVYDTKSLERGGVEYHKFPTVSKIPPTPLEVQDFCGLVDKLVAERDAKIGTDENRIDLNGREKRAIAVHCHYGYNRTGFFICSYLISRKGFGVQEAIDEFKKAKPPGIRHEHFLDVLWLRYSTAANQKAARSKKDELKGETGREENSKKTKRKTGPNLSITEMRELRRRERPGSARTSASSFGIPLFDFDTGTASEGDLM